MDMKLCLQDTNNLGNPFINRSKAFTLHVQCNFMRMVGDVNRQIDSLISLSFSLKKTKMREVYINGLVSLPS
jgi:hypothetical protein